ncbi:MAG: GGDEF domain-containing protein, partial [Acidobacteriota bacterium]
MAYRSLGIFAGCGADRIALGDPEISQLCAGPPILIAFVATGLVLAGAMILIGSLFTTRRLIALLEKSPVRSQWRAMLTLIVIFILGYLGYTWAFWNSQTRTLDLIVPGVFFLGGCFVWLTATLSLQTAVAVMHISLLEQENSTDALTGVFNRRYLDRRLNEEVTRAHRHGLPLSVLLLDIDHFKHVNDEHGHQAGDQVLALFAALIKDHLRKPDILARYGGEEFMTIVPHAPHKGAVDLAERLRACVESNRFNLSIVQGETLELQLTCSIGVASLGGELDRTERLVHFADQNLYRAKREGR